MTAGTVVITGGILATVILLCIIAVLCYCRLQVTKGDHMTPGHGNGHKYKSVAKRLNVDHVTIKDAATVLRYYCCKKDESEEDGDEPDFPADSHIPPLHCNRNVALTNGPSLYRSPYKKPSQSRTGCPSCSQYEPPTFFLQEPEEEVRNGGDLVNYKAISQEDLELPIGLSGGLQALNPNRLSAMREAFSRSRSISTDV